MGVSYRRAGASKRALAALICLLVLAVCTGCGAPEPERKTFAAEGVLYVAESSGAAASLRDLRQDPVPLTDVAEKLRGEHLTAAAAEQLAGRYPDISAEEIAFALSMTVNDGARTITVTVRTPEARRSADILTALFGAAAAEIPEITVIESPQQP
ncbi:MAG: hypothetical protein IKS31_09865 [Clostridia bacterium]|nr:hypothetical protein [Clostridia bacterium]